MTSSFLLLPRGLAFALLLSATTAQAQQAPVTGRMLGGVTPAAVAPTPAPPPASVQAPASRHVAVPAEVYAAPDPSLATERQADAAAPASTYAPAPAPTYAPAYASAPVAAAPVRTEPGDVTRQLLRLQASGDQAGGSLPMLGDQAHATYTRYLKSFEHELPEFFENTVGKSNPGGGN